MRTLNLDSSVINNKKNKMKAQVAPEGPKETAAPEKTEASETVEIKTSPATEKKKKDNIFKRIASAPKKLFEKFQSLSPVQKILFTLIVCVVIAGVGGLTAYYLVLDEGTTQTFTIPDSIPASAVIKRTYAATIILPEPSPPRDTPNPINGELFTKAEFEDMESRYPIAVMIENHISARPQSSFNSADLVFETLAEGGITRTMGIYWGKSVPEIGPIRSARQYFIEWLMPFDPLYMHIGYAVTDDPRTNAAGSIYKYGIKSMDKWGTFWRSTERFAPHNAYTSTDLLYEKAEAYGYTGTPGEIESWSFKRDAKIDKRGTETIAKLVFFERLNNGGIYDVIWTYDRDSNTYLRSYNAGPDIDVNTDTQVFAKNVIIQRVETISAFDDKARMIITTIGSGDAIILRDGVVIYGTWKKEDIHKRTRYHDADGNEIQLNRGTTWIEAVAIDQGTVQIEP